MLYSGGRVHRKASYMQTIRDHILHRNLWSFIPFPVISSLQKSSSYLMPVEFPAGTEHFMSRDLSHVRIQTDRSVNSVIILILGFIQIFQRQEADFSDSFFCRHFDYLIWFAFALFIQEQFARYVFWNTYCKIHTSASSGSSKRLWISFCFFHIFIPHCQPFVPYISTLSFPIKNVSIYVVFS